MKQPLQTPQLPTSHGGLIVAIIPSYDSTRAASSCAFQQKVEYCIEAYLDQNDLLAYHVHNFDERNTCLPPYKNPHTGDQTISPAEFSDKRFGVRFLKDFQDTCDQQLWELLLEKKAKNKSSGSTGMAGRMNDNAEQSKQTNATASSVAVSSSDPTNRLMKALRKRPRESIENANSTTNRSAENTSRKRFNSTPPTCHPPSDVWVGDYNDLSKSFGSCVSLRELEKRELGIELLAPHGGRAKTVYCKYCTSSTSDLRSIAFKDGSIWIHLFERDKHQLFVILRWESKVQGYVPWMTSFRYSSIFMITKSRPVVSQTSAQSSESTDLTRSSVTARSGETKRLQWRNTTSGGMVVINGRSREELPKQQAASSVGLAIAQQSQRSAESAENEEQRSVRNTKSEVNDETKFTRLDQTSERKPVPNEQFTNAGRLFAGQPPSPSPSAASDCILLEQSSDRRSTTQFNVELKRHGETIELTAFTAAPGMTVSGFFEAVRSNLGMQSSIQVIRAQIEGSGAPPVTVKAGNATAFDVLSKSIERSAGKSRDGKMCAVGIIVEI